MLSRRRPARRRSVWPSVGLLLFAPVAALGVALALGARPAPEWNPLATLDPDAPETLVTPLKLMRAGHDPEYCLEALRLSDAVFTPLPDEDRGGGCLLESTVRLRKLSRAEVKPVRMRCALALRLYMWERHGAQPAAQEMFGESIARVEHYGSYSCRRIRTTSGSGGRLSEHAFANAFDISGVRLSDNSRVMLKRDWGDGARGRFLNRIRKEGCARFNVVLGPDYNALHADHFHFDMGAYRTCR